MGKISKEKHTFLPVKLLKELLRYEYETGLFYWLVSRGKVKVGKVAGTMSGNGYIHIQINGYNYLAHRLVWNHVHGESPNGEQPYIDHINGKRDDNRITNLRVSSSAENHRNKQMMSNNTSGVTGIYRTGTPNSSRKNPKINYYWLAYWRSVDGKSQYKRFNIEIYGEECARQLAINHRKEQIQLLETNHNIKYSERYGI